MPAEFGRRSRAIVVVLALLLVAGSLGATPPSARAAEPEASVVPATSPSPESSAAQSAKASTAPVDATVQAQASQAPDRASTSEPEPGPPSDANEREDLRTESSLTYEKPDGSRVTEVYPGPINYRVDGGGSWLPIDLDFKSDPGDAKAVAVDESPIGLRVAPASDDEGFLTLTIDGYEIHLRPVDAPPARPTDAKPATSGSVADVIDALPGIDLRVAASASGVNSFFILDEADATVPLEFMLDAPGLNLSLDKETGAIALLDRGGTVIASMLAPYAVDSTPDELTGGGRITSDVRYALAEVDGRQIVTISVDPDWLAKATYPVYVDPTIYNNGSTTYGDAHVNQGNPTLNYANYQRPDSPGYYEMWLGESPSDSTYYNEAFIKFDLSSIAGTTIDSANLEVRPYHQYYNAPTSTTTWLRRVTATWAENTIKWSNKPSAATGPIDTTGCVEGQQCAFAITALVRGWLDGTYSNYGVRLDENGNGPTYWKRLIASEEQTSTRPRLIVTNHVPVASTTTGTGWTNSRTLAWSYTDSGGHAQSDFEVDVSTVSNFASYVYDGAATAGAGTSFSIPGGTTLIDGTTYHWRVRVKDGTSWSAWDSSSIQWDAAAPTGGSISVNAGATYTTSATVTLNLAATDANSGGVQMQPSDDGVNGTWVAFAASPAWTLPGADGTKTVYVRYRDVVQNTTGWINDSIVLDTVDPTASIAINNGAATTATQSVTLNVGSGDATSGVASTKASNDNSVFTTVTGPAAAWTLTAGDGTKTVWFKVTDNAGRTKTVSDTITLATDTTPPGAPSTPDLDAASDSGASSTDDVTNDNTPTFSGTAEANSTVTIYSGAVAKGTGTANGSGAWTVTTSALTDAVHSITATATDAANNTSPASNALSVTIDTTAPSAPSTPDLDAASDSGASNIDNTTNDTTPTLLGTATTGTTVTAFAGAAPIGTGSSVGGAWTITSSALTDGSKSITARASDLAGNISDASSGLGMTVDATAPSPPSTPDLDSASDSGISSSDNISSDTTPTFTGSADANTTLALFVDTAPVGSTEVATGSWSITIPALGDGARSVVAMSTDVAGNVSSGSSAIVIVIDTVEPAAPSMPDLDSAADTGTLSSDDVTNVSSLVLMGSAETGVTVRLYDETTSAIGSGTAASGSWSITSAALATGDHILIATATDPAGNAGVSSAGLHVSIDQIDPAIDFLAPGESTSEQWGSTAVDVGWTATDPGSGVAGTTLQRQSATPTGSSCPASGWANDGSSAEVTPPYQSGDLELQTCYRWVLTITDGAGNQSETTSGSIRIGHVALSSPLAGDAVFDVEPLRAEAEIAAGVSQVEFLVDGVLAAADDTAPYEIDWSTAEVSDGEHTVQARLIADDSSEELAPEVTIVVDNSLAPDVRINLDFDRGRITADERALYGVYAFGSVNTLPQRYISETASLVTTPDIGSFIDDWGSLASSTQTEISDFVANDLRGEGYDAGPGVTVGRNDPAFKDCHFTAGGRFGTTTYCKTSTPNFTIVYWLATPSHPDGSVPEVDNIDENLNPGGNEIPDVVDQVAWSLEDARAMYESWGYRSIPENQKVWLRQPPCGGDGCATNYPGLGLEISIHPDTPRPIYVARHELFHLVQYRYATSVSYAGPFGLVIADDTAFWTEATAEWAAHKVDLASSEKDAAHEYQTLIANFLAEPSLALERWESPDQGQRQYGAFIFAAYLEEQFGPDFLRAVWDERADGSAVDTAIRDVAAASPYSADYLEILDAFARDAYLMDFTDPDVAVWQTTLEGVPVTTSDADGLGGARPKRDRQDLTPGVTVTGSATIDPGGFSVLELVPPAGMDGTLHMDISVPDDHFNPPEVHIRQLALDPYPTVCSDVMLENGESNFTQFAGGSVTPLGPSSCRYAAYIFTNTDTLFAPEVRTVEWSARFDLGATLIDPFDRTSATGWGSGPLGNWVSADSSFDPYLSVDGSMAVANQVAPGASGVMTTGVAPDFVDPATDGPIELLFTIAQSAPAMGPSNPLIDDAFRISGDLTLSATSAGVRLFNYPSSQYATWHVSVADDRASDNYVQGSFTPTPYGGPIRLRLRVDEFGTYAKLWMASQPEPKAWSAFQTSDDALPPGWAPSWIVLQPRQTPNGTGTQTLSVDEVVIVSGAAPPGG